MLFVPTTRTSRIVGVAAVCTALALALTACTSSSSGGSGALAGASGGTSVSAAPSAGATTPPATPTTTSTPVAPPTLVPATHAYPSDYAGAILAAWKAHDTAYLTLLTSASTATKLYGFGSINHVWTGLAGSGAAGSTYWQYYNSAGDWLVLRTSNVSTGAHKWHAGEVYTWDQMTFPDDPTTYVKRFIDGWLNGNVTRMQLLSSTAFTTQVQGLPHKPELGNYTLSDAGGAAGHSYIEVKQASANFDVTLQLVNANVGHHNAIELCQAGC